MGKSYCIFIRMAKKNNVIFGAKRFFMNKLFLGCALLSLLIISCKETEPVSSVTVNLENAGISSAALFSITEDVHIALGEDKDSTSLAIDKELILNLKHSNYGYDYIHIKPGEQLTLDTLSIKPLAFSIVGSESLENHYLREFAAISKAQKVSRDLYKKEADSFKIGLKEVFKPLLDLNSSIQKDTVVSDTYKLAMNYRTLSDMASYLGRYKSYYKYYTKEEPTVTDDFYSEALQIDLTDPLVLTFASGRDFATSWHSRDVNYEDYESIGDYYNGIEESYRKTYGISLITDYCEYNSISEKVNFGSGIDANQEQITKFQTNVTNTALQSLLETTLEPWQRLRAGMQAPDFIAENPENEKVSLADLNGKKVYIDVWATWCGPCIAEIPSLKELEEELGDEIQFVSVSIDQQKDKEKWAKFIMEKELGGLQLMADGAWKSDIAKSYNIKGIPRFLLLDEEGKIITANAPRPSDPSIKETLLN